jgi:hypothetical protein
VWRPEDLQQDYFNGKVLSATAGGLRAPNEMDGTSEDVRSRLSTDSVVVEGAVAGTALSGPYSSIASVYNFRKQPIFMLGQRRGSLVFSLRLRAADFGVRNPMIRLDSVFPRHRPARLDTIRVAGGVIHRQLWIRAEDHGVVRERTLPLDAGLGWSYFLPFDYEYGTEAPWLTALWLAGLSAPALAWAVRAGRATALAVAASLALALLVIPYAVRAHPTAWRSSRLLPLHDGLAVNWSRAGRLNNPGIPPVCTKRMVSFSDTRPSSIDRNMAAKPFDVYVGSSNNASAVAARCKAARDRDVGTP